MGRGQSHGYENWQRRLEPPILGCRPIRVVVQWRGRAVRLAIEHDGFAYHSDRGAYRKDRLRRNAIERAGWALLELTYEDVLYNRSRSADLIFATLQGRWQADRSS